MTEPPLGSPPRSAGSTWAKGATIMVVVAIGAGLLAFIARSCLQTGRDLVHWPGDTARAALPLIDAWNKHTLEVEFAREWTEVLGTNYLQFTTLKQGEVFTAKNDGVIGGYHLLPEVIVDARAPVEYTYYVDLAGPWEFRPREKILEVIAPPIRFNKPAIDASKIEYSVRKGSVLRDERAVLEDLKKSLAQASEQRATENIPLIRELGRKKIEDFVRKWALRNFTDGDTYQIRVQFEDEAPPPAAVRNQL